MTRAHERNSRRVRARPFGLTLAIVASSKMKSYLRLPHISNSILILIGALVTIAIALGPVTAHASVATCEELFSSGVTTSAVDLAPLVDSSWLPAAETHYASMLINLGVKAGPGLPPPQIGIGNLLFTQVKLRPQIENQYARVGFTTNESAQRLEVPETFSLLVSAIESAKAARTFKLATYNAKTWFRLDQKMMLDAEPEVFTDLAPEIYASMVADGYAPLWASKNSLSLFHDLTHIIEYIEHPEVFPALQKYFQAYVREGWQKSNVYSKRPTFFNEVSYILKPEKYADVENLMVTDGIRLGSLPMHVLQLRKAIRANWPVTLAKIDKLTDAFDALFYRHGGGVRDVQGIEIRLSPQIIEHYVNLTKSQPSMQTVGYDFPSGFLHEFIESPEGLKRQIQFVTSQLAARSGDKINDRSSDELQNFLAYRVAQLEVAILTQRKLQLSQVDIIEDSMLPPGSDSKTLRYLRSYLPPNSQLLKWYAGPS